MTLRLILTRHAKSSWDDPSGDDHSRGLNSRGRRSASATGQWLNRNGFVPELVLCSSAVRTSETWALMADEMLATPKVRYENGLYLAAPESMLSLLRAKNGPQCVLMLAHNPGSALFAAGLAAEAPAHPQFRRYPTAATTVLDFDATDWKSVGWGQGNVVDFVVPRDLI